MAGRRLRVPRVEVRDEAVERALRPEPEQNRREAESLSAAERDEIRARTWQYLETFDYRSFV